MNEEENKRRPIKARNTQWAMVVARFLKNLGLTPNSISVLSVCFAALAGVNFALGNLIYGAILVQCRLLCNLFDGMVAIEFGLKSKSGEIFNDFPDRPADIFTLVGAGYAIAAQPYGIELGWISATLAVLTAYVRVLGTSAGASTYFTGPMAKPHRMATITLAAIAGAIERKYFASDKILWVALIVISAGSLITVIRRIRKICSELESK